MPRDPSELRLKGPGLKARFVRSMTAALLLVVAAAGVLLYLGAARMVERVQTRTIGEGVRLTHESPERTQSGRARLMPNDVRIYPVTYGDPPRDGTLFSYEVEGGERPPTELIVPGQPQHAGTALLGLIAGAMVAIVVVGAAVAYRVATQVTSPVEKIIHDVRQISKGDLEYRIRATGGGEIELLARSIDRMTAELEEAQEAEVELSIRERELSLAGDVREALLPVATPLVEGYDLAAVRIASARIGGDFHDWIEPGDGRVGLLVCEVAGTGMPAALIGATARSYLRAELVRVAGDRDPAAVAAAFARVNVWLGGDVRRGVYVSALYALVDPLEGVVTVASAGHRIPLLRISAADGALRQVHPDGIALGLDKGPVFERRLDVQQVPIEPGDRLFLSNSGPVRLTDPEGRELGEKAFYRRVLERSRLDSAGLVKALRHDLERFAGDAGFPHDISLVTIAREVRS